MKNQSTTFRTIALAITASASMLLSVPTQASSCKGLSDSDCNTNAQCRWVNAYTRGDGKQVSGYCRAKPVKRNPAQTNQSSSQEGMQKQTPKG